MLPCIQRSLQSYERYSLHFGPTKIAAHHSTESDCTVLAVWTGKDREHWAKEFAKKFKKGNEFSFEAVKEDGVETRIWTRMSK